MIFLCQQFHQMQRPLMRCINLPHLTNPLVLDKTCIFLRCDKTCLILWVFREWYMLMSVDCIQSCEVLLIWWNVSNNLQCAGPWMYRPVYIPINFVSSTQILISPWGSSSTTIGWHHVVQTSPTGLITPSSTTLSIYYLVSSRKAYTNFRTVGNWIGFASGTNSI